MKVAAIATLTLISLVMPSSVSADAPAVAGESCVIAGGTNYGTITQNCVINPAPPPVVLLTPKFEVAPARLPDIGFTHRILVRLTTTEDLILVACGDGVLNVSGGPWPIGMSVGPDERRQGNCILKRYQNAAAGKWALEVDTEKADTQFTLKPTLQ